MKRILFILLSLLTVCTLLLSACEQVEPYIPKDLDKIITPEEKPEKAAEKTELVNEEEISKIVSEAGSFPKPPEEKDDVTETEVGREGDYKYMEEKHDVVDNIDSVVYLIEG